MTQAGLGGLGRPDLGFGAALRLQASLYAAASVEFYGEQARDLRKLEVGSRPEAVQSPDSSPIKTCWPDSRSPGGYSETQCGARDLIRPLLSKETCLSLHPSPSPEIDPPSRYHFGPLERETPLSPLLISSPEV